MFPSSPVFTLALPTNRSLRITVVDSRLNDVKFDMWGDRKIQLPRGLYAVRVEGPTGFEEQMVRLDRDVDLSAFGPKRMSAAPIPSSGLTHEYYSGPSREHSLKHTRGFASPLANAEVFIFVRAIDASRSTRLPNSLGLTLFRADGSVETSFADQDVARGRSDGWLAFTAALPSGFYRLRSGGPEPREIGVHLFRGWQTQIFLLIADGPPLLEAARIFLARIGTGFQGNDRDTELVDDGIAMLANPSSRPPDDLMLNLLHGKFENPVLGLIGAHLLLRRGGRDAVSVGDREFFLSSIIHRLSAIIGDCPDIRALRLALRTTSESAPVTFMFDVPPMFLAGFQAVVDAAATNPSLVGDSPLMEDIAESVLADSVWTTWDALLPAPKWSGVPFGVTAPKGSEKWRFLSQPDWDVLSMATIDSPSAKTGAGWLQLGVLAAIDQELARSQRPTSRSNPTPNRRPVGLLLSVLAKQLEVSPQRVSRVLGELDSMSPEQLAEVMGENLSPAVRSMAGTFGSLIKRDV